MGSDQRSRWLAGNGLTPRLLAVTRFLCSRDLWCSALFFLCSTSTSNPHLLAALSALFPVTLQQHTSLCLVTTTPSLGDCFLFWELLIWFTSLNEESAHISSPSLTSICQIYSQRLLMKAVSQHP